MNSTLNQLFINQCQSGINRKEDALMHSYVKTSEVKGPGSGNAAENYSAYRLTPNLGKKIKF